MDGGNRLRLVWIALAIVALLLRAASAVWWQQRLPPGTRFVFGDSESYWELGRAIARGEPYQYGPEQARVFRTPGYPLCLAPLFLLCDDPPVLWGRLISAALGVAAVLAAGCLAAILRDGRTALVTAGLASVYPGAIAMSIVVLSEAPFVPLMLLQLICLVGVERMGAIHSTADPVTSPAAAGLGRLWPRAAAPRAVLLSAAAGATGGLATLCRPSWLLFIPLAAVVLLALRGPWKTRPLMPAAMLAAAIVVLAPWWIRNYQAVGTFVPTSLQAGAGLYDGWNPNATGGSDMRFVQEYTERLRAEDRLEEKSSDVPLEVRLDRVLWREACAWAAANPLRVWQLAGIKFLRMWNIVPNAAELSSPLVRWLTAAGYAPLIGLAGWGLLRPGRKPPGLAWCLLPAVYLTGLHMVFVSSIRYREPAMLALTVPAAIVLVDAWDRLRGRTRKATSAAAQQAAPTSNPGS